MDGQELKINTDQPDDALKNMHRHINPDGTTGGLVEDSAFVAPTATVGPNAVVRGSSRIEDTSEVKDGAQVIDAVLSDHAVVEGQGAAVGGEYRGETVCNEVIVRGGSLDGGRSHPRINTRSGGFRTR